MLSRFTGPEGPRLIREALLRHSLVQGDAALADLIATAAEVGSCKPGDILISQDGPDNDLYLILLGRFSICVHGREVACRVAGQHVGEMALIDPKARRSASVVALEESVFLKIPEPSFTKIAEDNAVCWRILACELADRLRQRNQLVRRRNEIPRLFIGSSVETLEVAAEIQAGLKHDPLIAIVWANRVFGPSGVSIDSLEDVAFDCDFAALVLGPDDRIVRRDKEVDAPRDNVILELGLFIGALGRKRVFMVLPHEAEIKIPTDLMGVTPITYVPGVDRDLAARLGPVCTELRLAIAKQGPR